MNKAINQSQWTGQFAVAAELSRRGHQVSFTLGNAPDVDLICINSKGKKYAVQIKTTYQAGWLIKRQPEEDIFYFLVHNPKLPAPLEFYILTGKQARKLWLERQEHLAELIRVKGSRKNFPGILRSDANPYLNAWEVLDKEL